MSHNPNQTLHGYADRALDIRVDVTTSSVAADYSAPGFKIADVLEKTTGITASDPAAGTVYFDLTLTQTDMNIAPAWYRWELYATRSGEVRTLAHGLFHIGDTPSDDESS